MAGLDDYLTSANLFDCQGGAAHRLTLLIDGRIRVQRGMVVIVVDPSTGRLDPPGALLPDHVLHAAEELAGRQIPRQKHRHTHL